MTTDEVLYATTPQLFDRARHEHYEEPEGLQTCPAAPSDVFPGRAPGPCDCGADEANAALDELARRFDLAVKGELHRDWT